MPSSDPYAVLQALLRAEAARGRRAAEHPSEPAPAPAPEPAPAPSDPRPHRESPAR
ncbi:hypothetical protein GCM10017562_60270 [Streptomyces roseofulvus]|uniref:Uncharacterized protein n=2 Tax=Streptomyces TaxID=1883 RepID=A0ABU4KHF3_9ACTN|nr:hypothetical protein [Streptomyces roseolus]MDX2297151.1 hypothetical protein [Streptomyces roseolus]